MPTRRARRFHADEEGAIVLFTLFALIMMLIAGGIAIDVMRHEMARTRLQNTLDTAVLAAVGAPYGSQPKEIVQDYFAKAQMTSYLNEIKDSDIEQTLNTSILNSSSPGDSVVSIVPFSWDVAPGPDIFAALNVDVRQNYSTCLQFRESDFADAAIDPGVEQSQLIYTSRSDNGFDNLDHNWRTCYTDDYIEIMPYSVSEAALHAKIDSLKASGNTSGEMGMKWGAALLDPKFQSVKTALNTPDADNNKVVEDLVGLVPAAYDESETLKIIVMMGDGENTAANLFPPTSQFRGPKSFLHKVTWEEKKFKYAYKINKKSQTSSNKKYCNYSDWDCVYESTSQSVYYLYNPNKNQYLNVEKNTTISALKFNNLPNDLDGFQSSEQLSWEMAWGMMSPDFLINKFNYYTARDEFQNSASRVDGWKKDHRMRSICSAIKAKGVIVYTIGFEVPKGGHAENELKACASSQAHYYRAEGINITDAFSSIASNVVNLRLTQ